MDDERELLGGVASRDPEAFRALMERHASRVINLAYRFLGTTADAEDAAQEVFFKLYRHPPTLNPETKLSTWLYRVTVNHCLDLLRRKPAAFETISLQEEDPEGVPLAEKLPDPSDINPRERLAQAETSRLARQAVAALPAPLRVPLILATFEELPQEEVARILGMTPKAVEHRLSRARSLLKQRLSALL